MLQYTVRGVNPENAKDVIVGYVGYSAERAQVHAERLEAEGKEDVEVLEAEVETPWTVTVTTKLPLPKPFVHAFPTAAKAHAFYDHVREHGYVHAKSGAHFPRAAIAVSLEGPEGVTVSPAPAVAEPGADTEEES